MKTLAPLASFERMKRVLVLVGYLVVAELADPRPNNRSPITFLVVGFLILEVGRQLLQYRAEVSVGAVIQRRLMRARWMAFRDRMSADARYKVRRFIAILAGLYAFGIVVDVLTDRCTGALQCTVLAPRLAIENLPTFLQIALYIAMALFQLGIMMYAMTKIGFVKIVPPGTTPETFDDVYGQDGPLVKVKEQVALLEADDEVTAAGGYMPKGVLLHGPPGTGKTLLAKAAANASTKPLILVPPGAFASTFVGINFLKVHLLFRLIRKQALRHNGVIVFFDEIDALGHRGGELEGADSTTSLAAVPPCAPFPARWTPNTTPIMMFGNQDSGTLTSFLAGMDGMAEPRGFLNKILALLGFKPVVPPKYRYLMMGATNRVGAIDPALLRAGRFGRSILVDFPNYDGRVATYNGYLAKVEHNLTEADIDWLARNHHQGTGAEIRDAVNEGLLTGFRDGREETGVVTRQDIAWAILDKRHGEATGVGERALTQWATAVHEAGHALVFHYLLRERLQIWFASIERRGRTGGMVVPSPLDEDSHEMIPELEATVQVSLASLHARSCIGKRNGTCAASAVPQCHAVTR